MESNEQDKRQMTVIAAEIERQKLILEGIQKNHDSLSGDIASNKVKHTISVLESLLPKEKDMILSAYRAGAAGKTLLITLKDRKLKTNDMKETNFNETKTTKP